MAERGVRTLVWLALAAGAGGCGGRGGGTPAADSTAAATDTIPEGRVWGSASATDSLPAGLTPLPPHAPGTCPSACDGQALIELRDGQGMSILVRFVGPRAAVQMWNAAKPASANSAKRIWWGTGQAGYGTATTHTSHDPAGATLWVTGQVRSAGRWAPTDTGTTRQKGDTTFFTLGVKAQLDAGGGMPISATVLRSK